jgi:hypothetical protein
VLSPTPVSMYRYRYLITGTVTDACGSVGEAFSKENPADPGTVRFYTDFRRFLINVVRV